MVNSTFERTQQKQKDKELKEKQKIAFKEEMRILQTERLMGGGQWEQEKDQRYIPDIGLKEEKRRERLAQRRHDRERIRNSFG